MAGLFPRCRDGLVEGGLGNERPRVFRESVSLRN